MSKENGFKANYLFHILNNYGFDYRKFAMALKGTPEFIRDLLKYKKQGDDSFPLNWKKLYPIMSEKKAVAGAFDGHYFYQDMSVAKKIMKHNPEKHVDIGSRMDGFISSLLVFRDVHMVDIRPFPYDIPGLHFIQDDATEMRNFEDNSLESISTLHAAEHFGLGRYGDPVEPDSYKKFAQSLVRVLAPGGRLYFSLPSGKEALYFNAHRVFSPFTILDLFKDLELVSLDAVLDNVKFVENCSPELLAQQTYGCGIYEFKKR